MTAPCKNCKSRQLGCHSTCLDYIAFRKKKDDVIEERLKLNREHNIEFERIGKTRKEFTRRTGKSVWR